MESNPKTTPDEEPVDASKLHIWQIQAVRDVLLVAPLLAILWLGYAMSAITVPLLLALALILELLDPLALALPPSSLSSSAVSVSPVVPDSLESELDEEPASPSSLQAVSEGARSRVEANNK